jgi:hypothetical protein
MTCVSIVCGIVIVSCAIAPAAAHGQRLTERGVGSRVRIDTADGALVTGTVVSVDADTARIASGHATSALAVTRSRIVSYEVSAGRERARGAKRGTLIGGGIGLAVIALSLRRDTTTVDRQASDLGIAIPAAAIVTLLGAGLGAALAPERWESPSGVTAGLRFISCRGRCVGVGYRRSF